jgi:hypothetical protein
VTIRLLAPRRAATVAALRRAAPTLCPRCGAPVIRSGRGELLESEPHPLAIDLPDGGKLTPRQAADAATGRTAPRGHHVHIEAPGYGCRPASQLALFTA